VGTFLAGQNGAPAASLALNAQPTASRRDVVKRSGAPVLSRRDTLQCFANKPLLFGRQPIARYAPSESSQSDASHV
jgi:hypothetical protein